MFSNDTNTWVKQASCLSLSKKEIGMDKILPVQRFKRKYNFSPIADVTLKIGNAKCLLRQLAFFQFTLDNGTRSPVNKTDGLCGINGNHDDSTYHTRMLSNKIELNRSLWNRH